MELLDGLLERIALDEPHGVVRTAAGIGAQAVDRDDAGVLQPAGDLGLGDEPLAADRVVGVLLEDLLQRHLAVQLAVERHEHRAQAAPRMRPQDAEPLAVARGRCRPSKVAVRSGSSSSASVAWPFLLRATRASVASISGSPSAARLARVDRLAGTAARLFSTSPPCVLEMHRGQRLEQRRARPAFRSPRATRWSARLAHLSQGPGLEGGHELALVDQARLKREQSEEEMAVGGGGHGEAPRHDVIPGTTDHGHGAPVARGASRRGYYRMHVRAVHPRRSALVTPGPLRLSLQKTSPDRLVRRSGRRGREPAERRSRRLTAALGATVLLAGVLGGPAGAGSSSSGWTEYGKHPGASTSHSRVRPACAAWRRARLWAIWVPGSWQPSLPTRRATCWSPVSSRPYAKWFDKAIAWTKGQAPKNADLRQFCREAAELLGKPEPDAAAPGSAPTSAAAKPR